MIIFCKNLKFPTANCICKRGGERRENVYMNITWQEFCWELCKHRLLFVHASQINGYQDIKESYYSQEIFSNLNLVRLTYLNFLYFLRSDKRQSSSQLLSVSHVGAGLASLFSKPTPPVRKNMNSSLSSSFLDLLDTVKSQVKSTSS